MIMKNGIEVAGGGGEALEATSQSILALLSPSLIVTGTFTTSSATVPADTGRTEASNYWNNALLIPLTGAVAKQSRRIKSFNNTGGVFTLSQPFTAAPGLVTYAIIAAQEPALEVSPIPDWSESQLTATIAAAAGTLTLPSVVMAALPAGAIVTRARAILTSRIVSNTNAAANKLNGATVAATSQVIQGGVFIPGAVNLSATVTGNGTYAFQWLLSRADVDAIVLQGVKMAIQVSYTL
jgi:hypothetical protein